MKIPNHVAIILDGNGRWAKTKGMPRTYGHIKGCENLEKICSMAKELGVKYLTVYAFSTENWKRSKEEVDGLMKLFRNYMKKCIKIASDNKMRVRVIGDPTAFDEDLQKKIKELADQFALETVLQRKAGKLSGGWQRRVSIAMALISEPQILFPDEPTLGLDVIARSELWDIIRSLKANVTIILTTHYMEEAEALSDRIGIMKDGKLLIVGTVQELIEKTGADRFENAFISIVKEVEA